jgi:hypothetical protein
MEVSISQDVKVQGGQRFLIVKDSNPEKAVQAFKTAMNLLNPPKEHQAKAFKRVRKAKVQGISEQGQTAAAPATEPKPYKVVKEG